MKNLFLLILFFSITCFSVQGQGASKEMSVAGILITKIIEVPVSKESAVYQVHLKSVEDSPFPKGFGLAGGIFLDDGTGNDAKANDGIYTSRGSNKRRIAKEVTVFEGVIAGVGTSTQERGIKIGCKFKPCGCPSSCGVCPACDWTGLSCWEVVECEISFELTPGPGK